MCFPSGHASQSQNLPVVPAAPLPPTRVAPAVERRVEQATGRDAPSRQAQTVLTSPLGDPNFGRSVMRTVLTGMLS